MRRSIYAGTTRGRSGIAQYSREFHSLVLKESDYVHCEPSSLTVEVLSDLDRDTLFHLELGANQHAEHQLFRRLVALGFQSIDVTLHDPPLMTFPHRLFDSHVLSQLSKVCDGYFNSFGAVERSLKRCRHIYVLTNRAKQVLESKYELGNVRAIPHVVDTRAVWKAASAGGCNNLLYFGFMGANKGLEYALELHRTMRLHNNDIKMFVVGDATNARGRRFLSSLKARFADNVEYLGYVPEQQLDQVFARAEHVVLPFKAYKYYCPASGSILSAMRRGRVVWTTAVNATEEFIVDRQTGFILTGDPMVDAVAVADVMSKREETKRIGRNAIDYIATMHSPEAVKAAFFGWKPC